jgi:anaerobic ribonucleoside-triphosphate reductase activating protein
MLIHGLISGSRVNGPGCRAVVYFQGCRIGCPGCWNPSSHAFTGEELSVETVTDLVVSAHHKCRLEGVTFSGGEPMQQADALLAVMDSLRDRLPQLSFGMYSGYSELELASGRYWCRSELTQLEKQDLWQRSRSHLDFAVLGRYVAGRPSALPLRTSTNQKLALFSARYSEQDFSPQEVEVHVDAEGAVQMTGFPTAGIPI